MNELFEQTRSSVVRADSYSSVICGTFKLISENVLDWASDLLQCKFSAFCGLFFLVNFVKLIAVCWQLREHSPSSELSMKTLAILGLTVCCMILKMEYLALVDNPLNSWTNLLFTALLCVRTSTEHLFTFNKNWKLQLCLLLQCISAASAIIMGQLKPELIKMNVSAMYLFILTSSYVVLESIISYLFFYTADTLVVSAVEASVYGGYYGFKLLFCKEKLSTQFDFYKTIGTGQTALVLFVEVLSYLVELVDFCNVVNPQWTRLFHLVDEGFRFIYFNYSFCNWPDLKKKNTDLLTDIQFLFPNFFLFISLFLCSILMKILFANEIIMSGYNILNRGQVNSEDSDSSEQPPESYDELHDHS